MGFAPYTADLDQKDRNFMYQMKKKGLITHNMLSIYSRLESGNSSFVKFGGWDEIAIADGSALKMFRTVDLKSWNL